MPSVPQGQDELQQHLTEHLNFIKRSGKAYDQGYGDEAKRLATSIRVLVHDTSMSRSLLAQLGLKDIQFLASGHQLNPESFMTFSALTMVMATNQGAVHEPLLDSGPPVPTKWVAFDDWWKETIIKDTQSQIFSRKELVLTMANKDGGSHVDPDLDEDYANLTRKNSMGGLFATNRGNSPIENIEGASVRQIAFELLRSIETARNLTGEWH